MPKAGGKRKAVDRTDCENDMEPTVYELERDENIRLRIQKMQELNIMPTTQELNAMHQTKRTKKVCIPMNLKCSQTTI
jgi:hypothetical protein